MMGECEGFGPPLKFEPTTPSATAEAKSLVEAWWIDPPRLIEAIVRALSERDDWLALWEEARRAQTQALQELGLLGSPVEELQRLTAQLRERDAKLAAKDAALQFAEGAIDDAIYTEAGLDPAAGEAVLHICREAREAGTFDQEPFDRSKLPSILVETLREQLREREREREDYRMWFEEERLSRGREREAAEREVERLREALKGAMKKLQRYGERTDDEYAAFLTRRPAPAPEPGASAPPPVRPNYPDPTYDPSLLAHERPEPKKDRR